MSLPYHKTRVTVRTNTIKLSDIMMWAVENGIHIGPASQFTYHDKDNTTEYSFWLDDEESAFLFKMKWGGNHC